MADRKPVQRRARNQRAPTNIFSMFEQSQIAEFKEAFNLIDQAHDGHIGLDDLRDMWSSLGIEKTDKELEDMLAEAPGELNFTAFLTMYGQKLTGTDPHDTLVNAFKVILKFWWVHQVVFKMLDEEDSGTISEERLREMLTTMGDRMTHEQVDKLLGDAPLVNEQVDYVELVRKMKGGKNDKGAPGKKE